MRAKLRYRLATITFDQWITAFVLVTMAFALLLFVSRL